ncbi:MAG: ATP-binding protein [Acidobacteria bacterium]|nr:MAG: ATP-binding protein [Acidobacteriota bacterium]PYR76196.1 MAG: ATP-binding protein [Acidobacteriota bacterium]
MTSGNTVRIDFHSSLGMLDFVQMVSDYIARAVGLDDDSVHWVSLAVRESVINAIKHGNCSDVRKRVHVEFTSLQDAGAPALAVSVRDEGCGFDPSVIADPLAAENLLKTNGRGIFLMRSFMDEMTFNRVKEGGMEVRMVKRVPQSTLA